MSLKIYRSMAYTLIWHAHIIPMTSLLLFMNSNTVPVWLQHLKCQAKIAADGTLFFYFYLSKEMRLDVSSESSARQTIHMKYQVLFSLKNNEKVFINGFCCSCDWRFKG